MRWPFACALKSLAARDERVVLLMGDVGGGLFSDFRAAFPSRYYNLGTAEQSMVGIAAGMALSGLRPVVYSFTPFLLERAYEQLKLDVGHNRAPVLCVGWQDATQGVTHQTNRAEQLIALLPGITGLYPQSPAGIADAMSRPDEWPAFMLLK